MIRFVDEDQDRFGSSPSSACCGPLCRSLYKIQCAPVTGAGSTGIARRIGPHTSCILLSRIPNGRQLDMWRWDYGENVNGVSTWSWVRYQPGGTAYYGYVSDYYLTNRGANIRC
jgi:hypothetical protein